METIEFETYIDKHTILLPEELQHLNNVKAKVVLYIEEKNTGFGNKEELVNAFKKTQNKGVFKKIENSLEWQKSIRDELLNKKFNN